jgi:hypothetical protein
MGAGLILLAVLAGVRVRCLRTPPYAFAVSLVPFSFEGTVKVLLGRAAASPPI